MSSGTYALYSFTIQPASLIVGNRRSNTLFGGPGDDLIRGGEGNDRLDGRAGNDSVFGEEDNDTLIGGNLGFNLLDGGADQDTVSYATTSRRVVVNLSTGKTWLGAERDTLVGIENLTGSKHADVLTGDDASNVLFGGSGDDILWGRGGDDLLIAGGNRESLHGEAGNDTISFARFDHAVTVNLETGETRQAAAFVTFTGMENVIGSSANDLLIGSVVANILNGRNGDDELRGDAGDDVLNGHSGNDLLYGGTGDDVLDGSTGTNMLYGEDGDDTFLGGYGTNFISGGAGSDTVTYEDLVYPFNIHVHLRVAVNLSNDVTSLSAKGDTLTGIENLTGGSGGDLLMGDNAANVLNGLLGDDDLWGGGGNDTLIGGTGADQLYAGCGDDLLWGGAADGDVDMFVFKDFWGTNRIMDWEDGTDLIDVRPITGVNGFADVTVDQSSGIDTVITAGNVVIILDGFMGTIDQNDFL